MSSARKTAVTPKVSRPYPSLLGIQVRSFRNTQTRENDPAEWIATVVATNAAASAAPRNDNNSMPAMVPDVSGFPLYAPKLFTQSASFSNTSKTVCSFVTCIRSVIFFWRFSSFILPPAWLTLV